MVVLACKPSQPGLHSKILSLNKKSGSSSQNNIQSMWSKSSLSRPVYRIQQANSRHCMEMRRTYSNWDNYDKQQLKAFLPDFKNYYGAAAMKTDERNRIGRAEIDPHIWTIVFDKCQAISTGRRIFTTSDHGRSGQPSTKEWTSALHLVLCTK
jgi:hypothetical protein